MSLHKRYGIFNIGIKQTLLSVAACILLAALLALCPTLARYADSRSDSPYASVAKWRVKLNSVDITVGEEHVSVTLIPDTDIIPEHPEKLKPGQTGHFDFVIDPDGTEVAFSYSVAIDQTNSNLPSGMTVDAYSVLKGADVASGRTDLDENKTASGTVALPGGGVFTSADSVTVRFYWTWADVDFDELAEYEITVTATVSQYLGEPRGGEGAQS